MATTTKVNGVWHTGPSNGGGGASTYAELPDKPKINDTELSGNKSAADLGLMPVVEGATEGNIAVLDSDGNVTDGNKKPSDFASIVKGYLYNGVFYEESAHTTEITPAENNQYLDITDASTPKAYIWNGSAYVAYAGAENAVKYTQQTLTEQQQTQARQNIGAASQMEVSRNSEDLEAIRRGMDEFGDVHAKSIDLDELPKVCHYEMIIIRDYAPNVAPDFIGQVWIDTATNKVYVATATLNASSYKVLN